MAGIYIFENHADALKGKPDGGAKEFRFKGFADGDGRQSKAPSILLNDLGGLAIELQEVKDRGEVDGEVRAAVEFTRRELELIIDALRDARWLLPHPREKQGMAYHDNIQADTDVGNFLREFKEHRPQDRAVEMNHRSKRSRYWL